MTQNLYAFGITENDNTMVDMHNGNVNALKTNNWKVNSERLWLGKYPNKIEN